MFMLIFILIVYGLVAGGIAGTMLYMDWGMKKIFGEAFLLGALWPLWLLMAALDGF